MSGRPVTHGASRRGRRTPEYSTWASLKARCNDPNKTNYSDYGGRGITVCERWNDFSAFLADMGPKPSPKHSIERLDNNAGYSPDNCVWATREMQARNRRCRPQRQVCFKGHPLTPENVYVRPNGKRKCRQCQRMAMQRFYQKGAEIGP